MTSLTVMTANVGAGLASAQAIARAVWAEAPDVVGMQELDAATASRLTALLSGDWPYTITTGDRNEGRGIFSRYPIVSHRLLDFAAGRPDLLAMIDINGTEVQILIAHPRPQEIRRSGLTFSMASLRQIVRLAHLAKGGRNGILLGDFNAGSNHTMYAYLARQGMQDTWLHAGIGRGYTFPVRVGYVRGVHRRMARTLLRPIVRFDYIWTTPDVTVRRAWIGRDTGSDHAPVVAVLDLS